MNKILPAQSQSECYLVQDCVKLIGYLFHSGNVSISKFPETCLIMVHWLHLCDKFFVSISLLSVRRLKQQLSY